MNQRSPCLQISGAQTSPSGSVRAGPTGVQFTRSVDRHTIRPGDDRNDEKVIHQTSPSFTMVASG